MGDFTILGSGTMGTAISYLLAQNGNQVIMWTRRKEICNQINKYRQNPEYLPDLVIPDSVNATMDLEESVTTASRIVIAIPSHGVYNLCTKVSKYVSSKTRWLSLVKGIDTRTRSRISQLLHDRLDVEEGKIAVLSGPNFAIEMVNRVPTIAVIASRSDYTTSIFRKFLINDHFLVEKTNDVNGVEIGGVLKNIGAIAIGLTDGLNMGDNTRGLISTKFLREALDIGLKVFLAKRDTLLGPACLGDMITTAFSNKSRNRILGLLASKCITGIPELTFLTEGRNNTEVIKNLADQYKIEIPVTNFVYYVLKNTRPLIAFNSLWEHIKKKIDSGD